MKKYRSSAWFAKPDKDGFIHRSWVGRGLPEGIFYGRPIIGICNTWSELTPCNGHFRELAEHVKRAVWEAGGVPFEFPVMSLGETSVRPTAMLFRNLAAMDVEESIRANPIDGVVLLCGCDKTTPSLIMGAASCDIPAIVVTGGPMLNGKLGGRDIGSGTAVWQLHESFKAGEIDLHQFLSAEGGMSRSAGTCNTMGTASTMATLIDVLGLSLPGASTIPAVDAEHARMASDAGRRIVEMVWEDLKPSDIVTPASLQNAVIADMAISGSTNSLIHLVAMARRFGHPLSLDSFAAASEAVPVICNLMPAGKYLMEDPHFAGGLMAERVAAIVDRLAG